MREKAMTKILRLTDDLFLGKGAHKSTYAHPTEPGLCVKILHTVPDYDWDKELRYRRTLGERAGRMVLITRYYGTVETNKGTGYLFERVVNFDGTPCKSLSLQLKEFHGELSLTDLLLDFKKNFLRECCVVVDTDSENFFVQQVAPDEYRIRIVDNIGTGAWLPILYYSDFLMKQRAVKYWRQFVHQIWWEYGDVITKEMAMLLLQGIPPMKIVVMTEELHSGQTKPLPSQGKEAEGKWCVEQLAALGNQVKTMAKRIFLEESRMPDNIELIQLRTPFPALEILLRLLMKHRDTGALYIEGTPEFAVGAILYAKAFHIPITMELPNETSIFSNKKDWRVRIWSKCDCYVAFNAESREVFLRQSGQDERKVIILEEQANDRASIHLQFCLHDAFY